MEFDSIIPVNDVCMSAGLVCVSQRRSLRHYMLVDGAELTVNTARNEWAVNNTNEYGTASTLAIRLGIAVGDDFSKAFEQVENLYLNRERIPLSFPFAQFSRPVWDLTETCHPKDAVIGSMITRLGLSMETVSPYSLEGSLPDIKGKIRGRVIAFRCGEDTEKFMAFDGSSFHQIGDHAMTVFGEQRKDRICMMYENPLDFLLLMESVRRNGVYPVMARRHHIVINGKRGIDEACGYLRSNPDFLEVRSFMPNTASGSHLFAAINDAVNGTAVDCSVLYNGHGSLLRKYSPRVPESYREWKMAQTRVEMMGMVSESMIVGQRQPDPNHGTGRSLGPEKRAVIDRMGGGLKL